MELKKAKYILNSFLLNDSWEKIHHILKEKLNTSYCWIVDLKADFIYQLKEDQRFCQMIKKNPKGRKACEESFSFLFQRVVEKKKPIITNCHAGFLEFASPLIIEDEIIGILGGCQLKDINLDLELYYDVARELFLEVDEFLYYISKEPGISSSDLEVQVDLINIVIKNILDSILKEIQLKEEILEEKEEESHKIKDFHDLFEASKELVLNLEPKKLYPLIVNMAVKAMNTQICSLMLIDENGKELTIKAAHGLSQEVMNKTRLKIDEGLVGYVIKKGEPLLVKDVEKDPRFNIKHKPDRYHTKSLIISPLKIENRVIGVLCMNNKENLAPFNEDDLNILSIICGHAAIAIENSRAYERVKKDKAKINIQAKELSILHDIGHELAMRHTPVEILELSLNQLLKTFNCHLASYLFWEEPKIEAEVLSNYILEECIIEQVKANFLENISSLNLNIEKEIKFKTRYKSNKRLSLEKILSFLAYPLKEEDKILGIIAMASLSRNLFFESEKNLFSLISKQISVNIKRALIYEEAKILIERDDLTNVYNYRYFKKTYHEEFEKAKITKKPISLIMLDFDHLKMYNDKYGHQKGSFIIKKIASLIEKEVKDKGWICRFGGDEFSIVLPNTSKENAYQVADSIRRNISNTTVNLDGDLHSLTASLGVATFSGDSDNIRDEKELLECADKALYQAKDEGRNRVCQYQK
jgi:diguanylate cyclase (GGDEF)-like protein